MKLPNNQKAFTLIELLLVVAVIATLAVIIFLSLNPAQRIKDAKDARRTTDVDQILSAIHEYVIDTKGTFPVSSPQAEVQLGTATSGCGIVTGGCNALSTACTDLSVKLVKYLDVMPIDPTGTQYVTKYTVIVDANNIVTVRACAADNGNISASR